jgi:hypothetical protein
MGMQEYRHILESICETNPCWNAEKILLGAPVYSNDAPVWIQYVEPADLCRIVLDLGALEGDYLAPVWRMMLESNCTNRSSLLPFLGMNPANNHAILIMHLSIDAFRKHACSPGFARFLDESLAPLLTSWRRGIHAISNFSHADEQMLGGGFA